MTVDLPEFEKLAKAMYLANPNACRFTVKSKPREIILKATDGAQAVKFRAGEFAEVKKIDKLARWMIEKMTCLPVVE